MRARAWPAVHGTPLYVYELAEVRAAYAALREALPEGAQIYYSLKANPHPSITRALRELGCGLEVSSRGELALAEALGASGDAVIHTGPGRSLADLRAAHRASTGLFSVESLGDLERLGRLAEGGAPQRVLLRVNPTASAPAAGLVMGGAPTQFGFDAERIREEAGALLHVPGTRMAGFHFYLGTGITSVEGLAAAFALCAETAAGLADDLGIVPELVDLGGGFPSPYACPGERPDLAALRGPLAGTLDRWLPGWRLGRPRIAFESGRYLVAAAGELYATVIDQKLSKGRRYVVLDTGVHHLGGMAATGRVPRASVSPLTPAAAAEEARHPTADLVGQLCTPLDCWSRGVPLPDLPPGSLVCIPNVGAYGLSASLLGFLSHPCPVELVLDRGQPVSASRLEITRVPVPLEQP